MINLLFCISPLWGVVGQAKTENIAFKAICNAVIANLLSTTKQLTPPKLKNTTQRNPYTLYLFKQYTAT